MYPWQWNILNAAGAGGPALQFVVKFSRGELTDDEDQDEKIRVFEVKIAALERKVGQIKSRMRSKKQNNHQQKLVSGCF